MNDYKKFVLSNGLSVILVPNKGLSTITSMILFGVGSIHETDDIAGISHVLEHMAFKGTEKKPTGLKISEYIDSIGGEYNAFTGKEYTGYYVKSTAKHIVESFDFLSDILLNAKYDEKELEKEKRVIIEELKMYEDIPQDLVDSNFDKAIFGDNNLGRDVIGTRETVLAVTADKLRQYKKNHYFGANAALVIAGNFEDKTDEYIVSLAEDYFKLESGEVQPDQKIEFVSGKSVSVVQKPIEQSNLVVGFRTTSSLVFDDYVLDIISLILGGCASSRMFEEIREQRGLAYSIRSTVDSYRIGGLLCTQAGVPDTKVEEAINAIINEYRKIKTEPVLEEELTKAKEYISGKMLIKYEDTEAVAFNYAYTQVIERKITTPQETINQYQKITSSDILNMAKKYFVEENMGLAYVGKSLTKEDANKLLSI